MRTTPWSCLGTRRSNDMIGQRYETLHGNVESDTPINWQDYEIRITDEYSQPESIISQGDNLILSRGNIMVIIGKAKSFKSFLCTSIVSGIEDDFLTLHIDESVKRILYIDTEQSKYHVQRLIQRVYRTCCWEKDKHKDNITVLALRPLNPQERLDAVSKAIEAAHPDLCIIDGIRDLLDDFNDLKTSTMLVNELMKWSQDYNCGIVTVIHQNKADKNARGHCGTELVNKSETVLEVVNTDGIATVSPAYSRNPPIQEFSFHIIGGLPELCEGPTIKNNMKTLKPVLIEVMADQAMKPADLKRKLSERIGKTERTAQRRINDAMEAGLLKKNQFGALYLVNDDEPRDLPF